MNDHNPLLAEDLKLDRRTVETVYTPDAFRREDENDDRAFYATDRFASHLDTTALAAVEDLIGSLVVERAPVILDLMASWDSHLPDRIAPARCVGLGLNACELQRNPALSEWVVHDLNREPVLPWATDAFDIVLNTVSVDYLTRPFAVFREVARVLRPGGLFLVVFSNRYFPPKVVRIWREASDQERVLLVEDYFRATGAFTPSRFWAAQGRPRPADDKYSGSGLPSDPVYAVFAEKRGGPAGTRPRRTPRVADTIATADAETVARRKRDLARTMRCPHCAQRLVKWAVPQTPFTEYDLEFLHVCFNDSCPYLLSGWEAMSGQGNLGFSHRFMYVRERDCCGSLPVPSLRALRESIVAE